MSAAEGGKVLGVNLETNVADLVKKGVIKTANDLMSMRLPDHFAAIAWEPDPHEVERRRREPPGAPAAVRPGRCGL